MVVQNMSNSNIEVSFVIPTYNLPDKTVKCFSSIRANTKTPYEIMWVDNGSTDSNFKVMKRAATRPRMHTKLIKFKHNKGFVKATNAGIMESKGKYIILLNNDTEIGWMLAAKLIRPLVKAADVFASGPVTDSMIGWQGVPNLNRRWNDLAYPNVDSDFDKVIAKKHGGKCIEVGGRKLPLSFFCCCIKRETFDKIGLLDEAFGVGLGDDDDFAIRMAYNGMKQMLVLGAYCAHSHRTTFHALNLPVDSIRRKNTRILKENEKKYKLDGKL